MNNVNTIKVVQIPEETFNEMVTEILSSKNKIEELVKEVEALKTFQTSPYFTIEEAMAYVRIKSRTTFREKVDDGLITVYGHSSPGRQLFIKEDLDAYILNHSTKQAA